MKERFLFEIHCISYITNTGPITNVFAVSCSYKSVMPSPDVDKGFVFLNLLFKQLPRKVRLLSLRQAVIKLQRIISMTRENFSWKRNIFLI